MYFINCSVEAAEKTQVFVAIKSKKPGTADRRQS